MERQTLQGHRAFGHCWRKILAQVDDGLLQAIHDSQGALLHKDQLDKARAWVNDFTDDWDGSEAGGTKQP